MPLFRKYKQGFTLVEYLMTITIIGILAGIGVPLTINLIDSFEYSLDRKNLSETAELALKRMIREIPRLQDSTSILEATASTYQFIDVDGRTITYQLSGTQLQRIEGSNTDILADNVASLTYSYIDELQMPISSPLVNPEETDIRHINIDLTFAEGDAVLDYTTRLKLRHISGAAEVYF